MNEEHEEVSEVQPKKSFFSGLSRADFTAMVALLVSLSALLVSVWEAAIMRDQQRIMQQQQESAVYPHLELEKALMFSGNTRALEVRVTNFGNGLAIINDQQTLLQNKPMTADFADELNRKYQVDRRLSTNLTSNVVAPGKSELIYRFVADSLTSQEKMNELYNDFAVSLCYRSIFDRYWLVSTERNGLPEAMTNQNCNL